MGKKIIHDTSEMRGFYPGLKKGVDRAVVAAAFKIRDTARTTFNSSRSLYKHATKKYKHLSEGINVGKFDETSETIKVHALGSKEDKDTLNYMRSIAEDNSLKFKYIYTETDYGVISHI